MIGSIRIPRLALPGTTALPHWRTSAWESVCVVMFFPFNGLAAAHRALEEKSPHAEACGLPLLAAGSALCSTVSRRRESAAVIGPAIRIPFTPFVAHVAGLEVTLHAPLHGFPDEMLEPVRAVGL